MSRTFRKNLPRKDSRQPRRVSGTYAYYSNKKLDNCNFTGANLKGANFSGSSLKNAIFNNSFIERTNFQGTDLRGASFCKVKANKANFRHSNLSNCIFDNADLSETNFTYAIVNKSSLWNSNICQANLSNSKFTSCNLERAFIEESNLSNSDFTNSNLKFLKVSKSIFFHSILTNTIISLGNFTSNDMTLVSLNNAIAHKTKFIDTILNYSNCYNIDASRSNFIRCNMQMAQFSDANLTNSTFIECKIYGTSFWNIKDNGIMTQSLDLSKKVDNSLLTDEIKFAPLLFLIENNNYFIEIINVIRLKAILILGKDSGVSYKKLKKIQAVLKKNGLIGIIAKEQGDILSDSILRKIATLATMSKFVIIENSEPSGHLYELPFIKELECITIILQEVGKGATWIFEDIYSKFNFIKKFLYKEENLEQIILQALEWAYQKNIEHEQYHLKINWLNEEN